MPTQWGGIFLSRFGPTQWHTQLWITGYHSAWWFWCGDWVSGWWVYSYLVGRTFCCSVTHFPGFIGKVSSLTNFLLVPGCEDYSFLDQAVENFEQSLDSILTGWTHQNWIHHLRSLILLLNQLQGSYSQLVPFLILLNCSLLPVSNLVSYGARLEHYFYLCLITRQDVSI